MYDTRTEYERELDAFLQARAEARERAAEETRAAQERAEYRRRTNEVSEGRPYMDGGFY